MKKGISKLVLAFVLGGLVLTLWVTWHGTPIEIGEISLTAVKCA